MGFTEDQGDETRQLDEDSLSSRMPEAEVSLRLALFLIQEGLAHESEVVKVAIDGAQIRTTQGIHFDVAQFFARSQFNGWANDAAEGWQGTYAHNDSANRIQIHSKSGCGDVVCKLATGVHFRAECKKGPLDKCSSSSQLPLL